MFEDEYTDMAFNFYLTKLQESYIKKPIDEAALVEGKVVRRRKDGIRLLGNGELKTKVELKLTGGATKSAVKAVEAAGGKFELIKKEVKPVVKKKSS